MLDRKKCIITCHYSSNKLNNINGKKENNLLRPFSPMISKLDAIIHTDVANMDSSRRTRIACETVNLSRYIIRAPNGSSRRGTSISDTLVTFFFSFTSRAIIDTRSIIINGRPSHFHLKRNLTDSPRHLHASATPMNPLRNVFQ